MTWGCGTVLLILRALCFLNYLHSWTTAPAPNGVLAGHSDLACVCYKNIKRKGWFGLGLQTNQPLSSFSLFVSVGLTKKRKVIYIL